MADHKQTKRQHYSGIGGQAILEGVMMRNRNMIACAVRKPNREIEVEVDEHHDILEGTFWTKVPFLRGIFAFIDSMTLGIKSLNYSAEVFAEDDSTPPADLDKKARQDKVITALTTVFSLVLAIGLFVILPYWLTDLVKSFIRSDAFLALMEGVIRLAIFLLYIIVISMMKDIRRLYQYHGAEHKCINCIERGKPLTTAFVKDSSRFHKRCGTSFLFLVMIISVILFFFIRVESPVMRIVVRLLMIPVVAGIAYEVIRLAGRSNNPVINLISAPGLWLQRITTKEPDDDMIAVGIASVEAVFDWRSYLIDEFGYQMSDFDETI